MNEGEQYKILDCSDKPVRIFSTHCVLEAGNAVMYGFTIFS